MIPRDLKFLLPALLAFSGFGAIVGLDWKPDIDSAIAQAKKQRKLVVVHFWLEGRPLAKTMADETFTHPEVIQLSNSRFINARIATDARPDLFEKFIGARGGLATCVLDASQDVVSVKPGYADAAAYLQFLHRVLAGYPQLRAARVAAAGNPRSLAALEALAEAYEALGSARRAETVFEQIRQSASKQSSVESRKYFAFALERLARFRALRGKNREASPLIAEYKELDAANVWGRMDRVRLTEALVAWSERRLKDALNILDDTLSRYPRGSERDQVLLALGTIGHEAGDDNRALTVLSRMLNDFPQSSFREQAREQIAHIKNPPSDHIH